jgi:hypothetical protein
MTFLRDDRLCIVVSVILNSTLYFALDVRMIMNDEPDKKSVMICIKYYLERPWEKILRE